MADIVKAEAIGGFPEWLPGQRRLELELIETIRTQFELFGFAPIQTPAVERLDVLLAKTDMGRHIFSVTRPEEDDSKEAKGGLRFDLTVPLARYVALHAGELTFPFRRYQIDKVWRGERAARGRFREFYQCDIDVIGRGKLNETFEAEIPCVINSVFEALGVPDFHIHISNRRVLGDLLGACGCNPESLTLVLRIIDKSPKIGVAEAKKQVAELGLGDAAVDAVFRLVECKTPESAKELLASVGASVEGVDSLESVIRNAAALGMPAGRILLDLSIARGLDYYTGTVFETFVVGRESWGSVCSGGRYDDLAAFFSKEKYPGVGVSIGLSRLLALLVDAKIRSIPSESPASVLVTMLDRGRFFAKYLEIAAELRRAGIATEVFLEDAPVGKQLAYAEKKGIPFAAIAGESEFDSGTVKIKELRERREETKELALAATHLLALLGRKGAAH